MTQDPGGEVGGGSTMDRVTNAPRGEGKSHSQMGFQGEKEKHNHARLVNLNLYSNKTIQLKV